MQAVRLLALVAALAAVLMLATSGPGTRLDLWDWRMGLTLMKWSMFAGFGAAAVALVLLVIPRTRGPRPSVLVAALLAGGIAGAAGVAAAMARAAVSRYAASRGWARARGAEMLAA